MQSGGIGLYESVVRLGGANGTDEGRHFTRVSPRSDDLECTLQVPLVHAICGFVAHIPFHGRSLRIPVAECEALEKDHVRLKGEGLLKSTGGNADLIVRFVVKMPDHLDASQKRLIRSALL